MFHILYYQEKDLESAKELCKTNPSLADNGSNCCMSEVPIQMVEEMLKKTKCLCSLIDSSMVDEVFEFLEMNRIAAKPEKV